MPEGTCNPKHKSGFCFRVVHTFINFKKIFNNNLQEVLNIIINFAKY
jgi:hypothetical protein